MLCKRIVLAFLASGYSCAGGVEQGCFNLFQSHGGLVVQEPSQRIKHKVSGDESVGMGNLLAEVVQAGW